MRDKIYFHRQFVIQDNGMKILSDLLVSERDDKRICYDILCCLWMISFKPEGRNFFENKQYELVEKVIKILQQHGNEKIARITLYFFKNLCAIDKCIEYMLDCDLDREVNKLQNRHWVDPDIQKNLEAIEKVLNEHYKVLSSFEKFKKQLTDKHLKWGPVHNDTFWSEHYPACEEDGFACIKALIALLEDGTDSTKAVACYDIGQFARFHPHGRKVLEGFHAKDKIIYLMQNSQSAEVREHALVAVQKMLITDWQKITKG